jgi:carboxymethylenebutenolidase
MKRLLTILTLGSLVTIATGQEWAKAKLEKSPRHQEWVKVTHDGREVSCFIVYPETKERATAVVLIHEIFGMTDWVRSMADQLAAAGYVVIAPDLLSGLNVKSQDAAMKAVSGLPPEQVTGDLNAAADFVAKLPATNRKVVVAGFCWGGGQAFQFATDNQNLKAAFVFYGPGPQSADAVKRIQCPVYGFYAGNDARVNTTLPKTKELMLSAGKSFDPVTYDDAGHGFMRAGEAPDANAANKKAHEQAWKRWLDLLKKV